MPEQLSFSLYGTSQSLLIFGELIVNTQQMLKNASEVLKLCLCANVSLWYALHYS